MPIAQTIKIFRGEDIELRFTMNPVVDVTGWVISFTVAKNNNTDVKVTQQTAVATDAPNGQFSVYLPKAVTYNIEPDVYKHDLWRVDTGSERILSLGDFIVGANAKNPA
jgi:hypothetical protein